MVEGACLADGVWGVREKTAGSLSGLDRIEDQLLLLIDEGEMQIEDGAENPEPAIGAFSDQGGFPAPQPIAHEPEAARRGLRELVPHEWHLVGAEVELIFHLEAALHRQAGPWFVIYIIVADQVGALIVEGPLAVADRAVCLVFVSLVRRIFQRGDDKFSAGKPGGQDEVAVFGGKIVSVEVGARPPAVAGEAGDGPLIFFGIRGVGAHEFGAVVAIDTSHAGLLVDIRSQLVKFHAIGPWIGAVTAVGRAVLNAEIVLKAAMVVCAHMVAVVAVEALAVCR